MSLNHTIRVFDYDYRDLLPSLVERHYEATIILTKLNKVYFDNEITVDKIKDFGTDMMSIMNNYSSLYCIISSNYIGEVSIGLKEAGLTVRNILTIPVNNDYLPCCNIKNRTYYDENKTMYVVFATKGCSSRKLNFTRFVDVKGSCVYPANWNWFIGSEIEACEVILKISSDHRDEVFDPFMNNGDIGVATIKADRHYTGTEPDGAKYRAARTRLDEQGE